MEEYIEGGDRGVRVRALGGVSQSTDPGGVEHNRRSSTRGRLTDRAL